MNSANDMKIKIEEKKISRNELPVPKGWTKVSGDFDKLEPLDSNEHVVFTIKNEKDVDSEKKVNNELTLSFFRGHRTIHEYDKDIYQAPPVHRPLSLRFKGNKEIICAIYNMGSNDSIDSLISLVTNHAVVPSTAYIEMTIELMTEELFEKFSNRFFDRNDKDGLGEINYIKTICGLRKHSEAVSTLLSQIKDLLSNEDFNDYDLVITWANELNACLIEESRKIGLVKYTCKTGPVYFVDQTVFLELGKTLQSVSQSHAIEVLNIIDEDNCSNNVFKEKLSLLASMHTAMISDAKNEQEKNVRRRDALRSALNSALYMVHNSSDADVIRDANADFKLFQNLIIESCGYCSFTTKLLKPVDFQDIEDHSFSLNILIDTIMALSGEIENKNKQIAQLTAGTAGPSNNSSVSAPLLFSSSAAAAAATTTTTVTASATGTGTGSLDSDSDDDSDKNNSIANKKKHKS